MGLWFGMNGILCYDCYNAKSEVKACSYRADMNNF